MGAPPTFQRTELSLKFVWLSQFYSGFSHYPRFPWFGQSILAFHVWAYDSLKASTLVEVIPLRTHRHPHCCEGTKRGQVSFAGTNHFLDLVLARHGCSSIMDSTVLRSPVPSGNARSRVVVDGVDYPLALIFVLTMPGATVASYDHHLYLFTNGKRSLS